MYKFKDVTLRKVMESLEVKELEGFEDAYIEDSRITIKRDENNAPYYEFTVIVNGIPKIQNLLKLQNLIKHSKKAKFEVSFKIKNYDVSQLEIADFCRKLIEIDPSFKSLEDQFKLINVLVYNQANNNWNFNFDCSEEDKNDFELTILNLSKKMQTLGFLDVEIIPNFVGIKKDIKLRDDAMIDEFFENIANSTENLNSKFDNTSSEFGLARKKALSNSYYKNSYKNENFKPVSIKYIHTIPDDAFNIKVKFDAMIYKKEVSKFNENYYYHFFVTDLEEAIKVTIRSQGEQISLSGLNEGQWINVLGEVKTNTFDNVKYIQCNNGNMVIEIPSKTLEREEELEDEKLRVELSTRSKMNTMDSILEPTEIVNLAKKFNQEAVAIIDSNSVQSFPEFTFAAKKAGIKPIYGVSFDVIKKNNGAILTPKFTNVDFLNSEVVAFDIETTHLSPRIGDIIEFGGSLIKNGYVQNNNFQFFMKAKKKLSAFTINLTNITDQMLENEGLSEREGLEKIYSILNNRVALAHNANFDMHFILQKFLDNDMELPNTVFVDSLVISRLVFYDKSKHALGDFCKNLGVEYNSEVAHRADYDAEVLAKAWVLALPLLKNLGIYDLNTLYNFEQTELRQKKRSAQITVLAKNQAGLKELFKLVTLQLTERFFKSPKLFWEDLKMPSENLLYGSGGIRSELLDALFYSSDLKLNELIDKFDYIEVPHPRAFKHLVDENDFTKEDVLNMISLLINRAKERGKLVVAIGDVRYANPDDQIFYKSLVYSKGIGNVAHFLFNYQKARSNSIILPDLFFLTTTEMKNEFSFLNDAKLIEEIVVENTNKIANQIENDIVVIHSDLYTPKFDNSKEKLHELVYKRAHEIYGENLPEIVEKRLEKEITPILKYGFDVVYWISHKLVKMSMDNGYLVGSRGSVGSSLVATMAGITEVNPLAPHYICLKCHYFELSDDKNITSGYDLDDKECPNCKVVMKKDGQTIPFETFLGFNADKVPDIDLNFSGDFQAEVHNEVKRLFGESHTFRAGTISTIKSKIGFGYIKKACEEYGFTYSNNFIDFLSTKIEGVKRTTGQHPGGIIIIPKEYDVEDFTPINYPADDISIDWKTTHFDFHAIHDNVLKLDILGHVDPTAIRMLENITKVDVKKDIPSKDPKVLSLFSSTEALNISPESIGGEITGALGLPEFGTSFVRRMLYEAKPESFADLISLSGLSHGTDVWSNNAQDLIKDQGMTIKDVISCRDDIMVYLMNKGVDPQNSFKIMEQVRKGKSITPEQEEELKKSNVPGWYIESMKKIKYLFPKAHATAYVLMAWRIAWFKLYHPLPYYATYLTTRVDEFDVEVLSDDFGAKKINSKLKELDAIKNKKVKDKELIQTLEIARELYARGFSISNIILEQSLEKEWVIDVANKRLIPPFSAIKGLGLSAAEKIVQARKENDFRSREDFKKRSGINQTLYTTIAEMGILNHLDDTDQMKLF
ncbi:PolC-type DNA polymerase III [Mycoplasmopsis glycophila]|uniref:DNA polymerase III PolC-type n=1 Tax=Mycoplasmopsis glycophila TaxID=171285 RepID=A0A449AU68_9BACT|nr:PolC-type DNA polymerase III [Mycoplasmopsis glycophila]VEU70069.1 DNA polymerase III polC-type [Mycoplasmopsis glycophila]